MLLCMDGASSSHDSTLFVLTKDDEKAVARLHAALAVITHAEFERRDTRADEVFAHEDLRVKKQGDASASRLDTRNAWLPARSAFAPHNKEALFVSVHESVEQIRYLQRRLYPTQSNHLTRAASPRALNAVQETLAACSAQLAEVSTVMQKVDYTEREHLYARNAFCGVEESLQELFAICAQHDAPASIRALAREQTKNRCGVTFSPAPTTYVAYDSLALLVADFIEHYFAQQKKEAVQCAACAPCPESLWCEKCRAVKKAADSANPPTWLALLHKTLGVMQPDDQLHYLDIRVGAQSAALDAALQERISRFREIDATDTESQIDQEQGSASEKEEGSVKQERVLTPVSPAPAGMRMLFNDEEVSRETAREDELAVHWAGDTDDTARDDTGDMADALRKQNEAAVCAHASLITAQELLFQALAKKDSWSTLLQGLPEDLAGALDAILETSPGKVAFAQSSIEAEKSSSGFTWLGAWIANRVLIGAEKKKAVQAAQLDLPEDTSLKEVVGQVHDFIDVNGLRPLVPTIRALLTQYGEYIDGALARGLVATAMYNDLCAQLAALIGQPNRERALGAAFSGYARDLGQSWWPKAPLMPCLKGAGNNQLKMSAAAQLLKKQKKAHRVSTLSLTSRGEQEVGALALFNRALKEYARAEREERSERESIAEDVDEVVPAALVAQTLLTRGNGSLE